MAVLSAQQLRCLQNHPRSRDGKLVPGADTMFNAACWNFALTGTELAMSHANSPNSIANLIFVTNPEFFDQPGGILRGFNAGSFALFPANCAVFLTQIQNNWLTARGGSLAAETTVATALLNIFVLRNGLQFGGGGNYRIHMRTRSFFGWDHFALSFPRPGGRVFVQTVTGSSSDPHEDEVARAENRQSRYQPLQHACRDIWDEGIMEVYLDLVDLHAEQVALLDGITRQCVRCSASHGWLWSNPLNAWHRCTVCSAVYCPTHGAALGGSRTSLTSLTIDRTRDCGLNGCAGRTEVLSSL